MRILLSESRLYSLAALDIYRELGELRCADFREPELLRAALGDIDVLVMRLRHRIDAEMMAAAPRLSVIVSPTTGLDHIDLATAKKRGINVLSLSGETEFLDGITATAELAWALILELARRVGAAHLDVLQARWDRDAWKGRSLGGLTLGLLGYGRLGRIVADYGVAFRMPVIAHDPKVRDFPATVRPVSFEELLAEADILSVHVPLTDGTTGLLGVREIARMKQGAWLVNTARGRIVDETALLDGLRSGHLGGAALDVLAGESATETEWLEASPLRAYAASHGNLILTPHIGGATVDTMAKTEIFMAQKLWTYLQVAGTR